VRKFFFFKHYLTLILTSLDTFKMYIYIWIKKSSTIRKKKFRSERIEVKMYWKISYLIFKRRYPIGIVVNKIYNSTCIIFSDLNHTVLITTKFTQTIFFWIYTIWNKCKKYFKWFLQNCIYYNNYWFSI